MSDIFDLAAEEPAATYDNTARLMPELPWLNELNPEQKQAVTTTEGPLLVLSGAGTGKTKVLTARLAYILANMKANPWNCLVVTFTNRAAREMQNRARNLIGNIADSVWMGTFHGIAVKILRRHAELVGLKSNFTILGEDDQRRLIKQLLEADGIDDKKYPPQSILDKIQLWKDKGLTADKIDDSFRANVVTEVYKKYQARLLELNCVDFGDLLLYTLNILMSDAGVLDDYQTRFKYIMVDEYQDTNVTQYLFLRLICQKYRNLCCVGDDDQSIYSWRGAEIENILRFEKDFPDAKVIRLERNYRSTANILAAASALIRHNRDRLGKTLKVAENSPAARGDNSKIKVVSTYSGRKKQPMSPTKSKTCTATAPATARWPFLSAPLRKPGNLKKNSLPKPSPIRLSADRNFTNGRKFATPSLTFGWFCSRPTTWLWSASSTNRPAASAPKPSKNLKTKRASTTSRCSWQSKKC